MITPGPGQYIKDYDKLLKSDRGVRIGNAKRENSESKDILLSPGPGQYLPNVDLVKRASANWRIDNGPLRQAYTSRNGGSIMPGPGSYSSQFN